MNLGLGPGFGPGTGSGSGIGSGIGGKTTAVSAAPSTTASANPSSPATPSADSAAPNADDEPAYSGAPIDLILGGDLGTGIILEDPVVVTPTPSQSRTSSTGSRKATSTGGVVVKDEAILNIFRLISHLGKAASGNDASFTDGPFQQELSKLSGNSKELLQQALASMAAQAPSVKANDPMLLRLAEHLAIRFALNRYESGEVRVNAVREMMDRMSQEISALRKVLGAHEETLAQAGIVVESHADLLDRQFWAAVPEAGKRAVLTSPEAWCIPPRNLRQFVTELRERGDIATADTILDNYAGAISNKDINARRRSAIGLSEIADLYAAGDATPLGPAIRILGTQLAAERETELQSLISAAFVRLSQEAGSRGRYPAVLQTLDSLDGIENQRPAFAQEIRPSPGIRKAPPRFHRRGHSQFESSA